MLNLYTTPVLGCHYLTETMCFGKQQFEAASRQPMRAVGHENNYRSLWLEKSIVFCKSTSQRIYPEEHTRKIGWKLHKYGLKYALHSLDIHFVWS